jgi:hypothetical protein
MSGVPSMDRITSRHQSGNRYGFLQVIGALFTVIGAVEMAIGGVLLVFAVYTFMMGTTFEPPARLGPLTAAEVSVPIRVFLGAYSLLFSFALLLSGLYFAALGGVIRLLVHLVKSMRSFEQTLDVIRMRLDWRVERVEPVFRS